MATGAGKTKKKSVKKKQRKAKKFGELVNNIELPAYWMLLPEKEEAT